jgi:hypothetical protein
MDVVVFFMKSWMKGLRGAMEIGVGAAPEEGEAWELGSRAERKCQVPSTPRPAGSHD